MDFITPPFPLTYQEPPFDVSESEKNANNYEWWISQNRYICSKYNQPTTVWDPNNINENLSPIERGLRYALAYNGKQQNFNFNHLTEDTNGANLNAAWIKNKKGRQLVDTIAGGLIKQLAAKEISAKSLSKRAQSAKMKLWEDVMRQYDERFQKIAEDFKQKFGITYAPPLAGKFNSQQDAEQYLTYSYKDDLEQAAVDIGRYVEWFNDYDTIIVEAFKQDFCPANYMGIYTYVENGAIKQKKIPFYNLIYDTTSDDPFVRDQKYCGIIELLTAQQIFKRYPNLNDLQRNEIIELSKGQGNFYNGFTNYYNTGALNWFNKRNNDVLISVVTTWWNGPHDLSKKSQLDKYGNVKIVNTKEGAKDSEFSLNDLHKSTMVANKYLVDWGYESNVVRSIANKANPEFPVKIFQNNTMLGDGVSPLGLVYDILVKMDAYDFKITEMMNKHIGKGYIINGSKLDVKSKEFIQDMKTMSIHVAPGVTGEANDPSNNQPYVYPVDFALDQAIVEYSNLYRELERRAEQSFNLSQIAMGQQENVIGKGVQQNSVALSSTGNLNLYQNLFKFNEICLQYAINLAKIVYSDGGNEELAPLIIGDRGIKALQIIKKHTFEDVLVQISPLDNPTEEQKARVISMMQAFAQNQLITPVDYVRIENATTWTEMENDLEYSAKKKEAAQAQQQQFDAQMQQNQIQLQNQVQLQRAQIEQDGANQRTKTQAVSKIAAADIKREELHPGNQSVKV